MAHERIIFARTVFGDTAFASPSDFITKSGREVSLRAAFYDAPEAISPYSLDVDRETVTFVRTELGVDLAEVHPFFYEAQRRHAKATITASFDEVDELGAELDQVSMRLAFLYSPGRCGSTVAGRVASVLPSVQSLSEPDIYSYATLARRPGDTARDAKIVRALRGATLILAAHRARVAPTHRTLLIKQRGMGIYGAPLVSAAVPSARSIYLDRTPSAVVDSYIGAFLSNPFVRVARRMGLDKVGVAFLRRFAWLTHPWIANHMADVIDASAGLGAAELLAHSVASMNSAASRFAASGVVRFHGFLHYEELETSPIRFAKSLAGGLGLEPSPELTAALLSVDDVISVDAQAGSAVQSKKLRSLSKEDASRIDQLVAAHEWRTGNRSEVVA